MKKLVLKILRAPINMFKFLVRKIRKISFKGWSVEKIFSREKVIQIIRFLAIAYLVLIFVFGGIIYSRKFPMNSRGFKFTSQVFPLPATFVATRVVWLKNILQQEGYVYYFASRSGQAVPDQKELTTELVNLMVETELARRDLAHYRMVVTIDETQAEMKKIFDENGGEANVKKMLSDLYRMSLVDFRRLIEDQLIREKFRSQGLVQYKVRHILITDEGKAKDIAERAKKGENFEDLAKNLSEDQNSKDSGGDLGWVGRDSGLVPAFEEALFKMNKGQISDPVKSDFGFHIIKVEDKRGFVDKKYADWLQDAKRRYKVFQFVR